MPWLPEHHVTSRNRLRDNLIAYWTANQVEALAWAKSTLGFSATPALTQLTNFYTSTVGRVLTTFPHALVVSATTASGRTSLGDDSYEASIHTYIFEIEIAGTNADQITDNAECYVTAFVSVILNIPEATLKAGLTECAVVSVEITSVDPDELRGKSTTSPPSETGEWYKAPQITVTIELIESL